MLIKPSMKMKFEPHLWGGKRKELCACFSYAVNVPGLGFANLGGVEKVIPAWRDYNTIRDIEFVTEKALQDGFEQQTERRFDPSTEHITAVFTGATYDHFMGIEEYDCHHIRLDGDGSWSHKPGIESAQRIIVPAHVKVSKYLADLYAEGQHESWFVGFFKFPDEGMLAHIRYPDI